MKLKNKKGWFIREKVERVIRLTGFPLKTCGNDEKKQPLKVVILGLDPGIQGVFNLNTKDTKGFTLIEVIIAITLSAVIIAILLSAMRLGYRSQEKGMWREEISQKMRILNDRITWLLRGAYPYIIAKPEGKVLYFSGKSGSAGFVTTSVDSYSEGPEDRAGMKWVQIFYDYEGLKIREKIYFLEDVFDDSGGKVYLLDPSVDRLEFEYLDVNKKEKKEEWVSEWDPTEKDYLPAAVRVKMEFTHDGVKFKVPEFIVRLPAGY